MFDLHVKLTKEAETSSLSSIQIRLSEKSISNVCGLSSIQTFSLTDNVSTSSKHVLQQLTLSHTHYNYVLVSLVFLTHMLRLRFIAITPLLILLHNHLHILQILDLDHKYSK